MRWEFVTIMQKSNARLNLLTIVRICSCLSVGNMTKKTNLSAITHLDSHSSETVIHLDSPFHVCFIVDSNCDHCKLEFGIMKCKSSFFAFQEASLRLG